MLTQELRNHKNGIKALINDEGAVLIAWIAVLTGLFFLSIVVLFILPITNLIAEQMIELGGPYTQISFIRRMSAWSLGIMGVGLVAYGLMRSYRKVPDQGRI